MYRAARRSRGMFATRGRRGRRRSNNGPSLNSQSSSSASAVPRKREREADNEDEGDEDDWAEIAQEERMAKKVKKGETSQLEFDAEYV